MIAAAEKSRINLYFVLAILIIIVSVTVKYPLLSFRAEMYAETGTDLFMNARNNSFLNTLLIAHTGYLALLQRIIAALAVKVLHLSANYPLFMQSFSIFFIAVCAASINLKIFKTIISNDFLRFVLSLSCGLIPNYEIYTFINFIYMAVTPLLFLMLLQSGNPKTAWFYTALFYAALIVCILSKPFFLTLLPFVYIVVFLNFNRNKSVLLWVVPLTAAVFFQLIFMKMHREQWNSDQRFLSISYLWGRFKIIIFYYYNCWRTLFLNGAFPYLPGKFAAAALFFSSVFMFARMLIKRRFEVCRDFLLCQICALAALALLAFTVKDASQYAIFPVAFFRWYIFPKLMIFISLFLLVYRSFFPVLGYLLTLLPFFFTISGFFSGSDFPVERNHYFPWKKYHHLLRQDKFYIPILPAGWAINRKLEPLCKAQYSESVSGKMNVFKKEKFKNEILLVQGIIFTNEMEFGNLQISAETAENTVNAERLSGIDEYYCYFFFPVEIVIKKLIFKKAGVPSGEILFIGRRQM